MDLIMKTTERFDNAVTKLYNAFHKGELNAYSPCACAVGNMLDNTSFIGGYYPGAGLREVKSIENKDIGYSGIELYHVERIFIKCHIGQINLTLVEKQFKGLCAVVEYLFELDNIPNVMDYTKLFETENDEPKYELSCRTQ